MYCIKLVKINKTVTDFYLGIIKEAIIKSGNLVQSAYEWKNLNVKNDDTAIVAHSIDALIMIAYRKKYYMWCQGIWPEESYLKHKSIFRFRVLSFIEKLAISKAEFLIFVSKQMKDFYEKKYNIDFSDRCYIMPCSNDVLHKESFSDNKYSNNVFCYAGALSKWQCFEETLELYKKIESKYSNTKLLLLVRDKEYAYKMLKKHGIKNYEIDFVPVKELPHKLSGVKFGFLLREDSPINWVATPTKFMTYIGNGIIPIYSDSLKAINEIMHNTEYKVCYKNDGNIDNIEKFVCQKLDSCKIKSEYNYIYKYSYDGEKHINELSKIFRDK